MTHCGTASEIPAFLIRPAHTLQRIPRVDGVRMKTAGSVQNGGRNPTLRRWRVIEVVWGDGTHSRHVYGHDATNSTGLASSAIHKFDRDAMIATTQSGSNYTLAGVPGSAKIAEHTWNHWCRVNGVVSQIDVTDQYFSVEKMLSAHRQRHAKA